MGLLNFYWVVGNINKINMKKLLLLLLLIPLVSCTPKHEKKGFKTKNEYRNHLTDSIKSDIISEINIEFEEATSNILSKANQFEMTEYIPWFYGDAFFYYFNDNNKFNVIEKAKFSDDSMEIDYNHDEFEPLISCNYIFEDGNLRFSNCDKILNGEYIWGEANQLYDILDMNYKLKIEYRRSLLDKSIKGATLFLTSSENSDIKFYALAYKGSSDKILNYFINYDKYNNLDKQQYIKNTLEKKEFMIGRTVKKIMSE